MARQPRPGGPGIGAKVLDEYENGDIYRDDGPGDDSFASSAGIFVADRIIRFSPRENIVQSPAKATGKKGGKPRLKPSIHPWYYFRNDESLDVRSRQHALFGEKRHGAEGSRKNK